MCSVEIQNAKSVLPFKSVDAVSSPAAGAALDLEGVAQDFSMQATVTGSPDLGSTGIYLQGSLDGTHWENLQVAASGSELLFSNNGSSVRPYVRYVRANVTAIGSGSSPTVTVWIAAGEVI